MPEKLEKLECPYCHHTVQLTNDFDGSCGKSNYDLEKVVKQPTESKNSKLLVSFTAYCTAHPEERFWQALRNWSGQVHIFATHGVGTEWGLAEPDSVMHATAVDTFNWNGRSGYNDGD